MGLPELLAEGGLLDIGAALIFGISLTSTRLLLLTTTCAFAIGADLLFAKAGFDICADLFFANTGFTIGFTIGADLFFALAGCELNGGLALMSHAGGGSDGGCGLFGGGGGVGCRN